MGYVFQAYALFPWRTVLENVGAGLEIRGVKRKERREIAKEYIELVGLGEFAHRYPHELSGGMKQRVAIARALAYQPEVLLMDEPFAALDAQTREVLQYELLRIWEETHKTIVFVTHSIDEAVFLSDRVAVMTARPGRIKEIIEVPLARPRSEELRNSAAFAGIRHQAWELLKDEVLQAQEPSLRRVAAASFETKQTGEGRAVLHEQVAKAIKRFSGRGIGLVVFFALWEFLPRAGLVDQTFFSPPSLVLQALVSLVKSGAIWPHVESSIQRSFLGLGLSILLGTSLGIFLGWFKRLEYLVDPVLQTFRQLPSLALFPVFILFFGIGELSKVTIIFWASLWPILLNTINGVKNVDKILLDSAKSLGASQSFIFLKVVLPAAVPEIMTGIRLGGAHSVVALVAAEMIGAEAGLGFLVFYSQETFKVPNMFAAIVCLALVGLALNYLLVFIEARLTRWKRSSTENA